MKGKRSYLAVTLRKSVIGAPGKIKAIAAGLGLRKIRRTVLHPDTPAVRGMVSKVSHLVEVKEVDRP